MTELIESINKLYDTSSGQDGRHYQLLKHLPNVGLLLPLEISNDIWTSGNVPAPRKEAIVFSNTKTW